MFSAGGEEMEHRTCKRNRRKGAFTLAEFLVVVAITMILAGVSFVAVIHYKSRLRRLEMDQTAKEIFLAAQNQLSLEVAGGRMERLLAENPDSEDKLGKKITAGEEELYYILYQPGEEGSNDTEDIRQRLLPFGSIDETVRTEGSYIIIYDPGLGEVRETWYSDRYVFQTTDLGSEELAQAAASPEKRERYHGEAIGYYNGDPLNDPEITPDAQLKKPDLELFNKDVLYAKVADYMSGTSSHKMKLWVEGVSSGAKGWIDLDDYSREKRVIKVGTGVTSYVILDDVTWDGGRFAGLDKELKRSDGGNDKKLIAGEDLLIYAEASNSEGSVISDVKRSNSIFQDITENKVLVSSIRHLENLDYRISGFNPKTDGEMIGLTQAEDGSGLYTVSQQTDLSWISFRNKVVTEIHNKHNLAERTEDHISVYYMTGSGTKAQLTKTEKGCYAPVEPQFALSYEGNTHKIEDLKVDVKGTSMAGGCFGRVRKDLSVKDLKLVRPDITAETSSGAVVGFGDGDRGGDGSETLSITVENVLVQYPKMASSGTKKGTDPLEVDSGAVVGAFNGKELTIKNTMAANTYRKSFTGAGDADAANDLAPEDEAKYEIWSNTGAAGGLVGSVTGQLTISGCASSVYVNAYGFAGGLAGRVSENGVSRPAVIENSYVGGHTSAGKFLIHPTPYEENFNNTPGHYNIVSRHETAGGIAAVLPAGSQIGHTYVTASIYVYSDVYGAVPAASEENTQMNKANAMQDKSAFVTAYGNINAGGGSTVEGKTAADETFRYCYSASMVNGAWSLCYSDSLKTYFEGDNQITPKNAYSYDKTLTSTYPMLTVVQLIQADPAASDMIRQDQESDDTQPKQIPKFTRVHVGDWMVPEKEEPEETGMKVNNGNRLWVDYVLDIPENSGTGTDQEPLQVSFSIKGKSNGNTVYYLVKFYPDLSQIKFVEDVSATTIENAYKDKYNWGWPVSWSDISSLTTRRIEVTETGEKQIKVRLYLDSKAFVRAGIQYLDWNDNYIKAGDNLVIQASDKHAIPDDTDPIDDKNNSYFDELIYDETTGTYTAKVANSRHLLNLNFYDKNEFNITNVEQTDNILWTDDPSVPANTEAYCKELSEAYPDRDVIIYDGWGADRGYTLAGSFKSIQNTDIHSYDGKSHIIAGLRILPPKSGEQSTALFTTNDHLTVKNLNIKDPYIQAGASGAAVIMDTAGEINDYSNVKDGTYLNLENIRIYGDDVSLQGWSAGGAIVKAGVDQFTMKNVHVYGKNLLVGGSFGNSVIGGLAGQIKANTMEISNCSFSGYISGKNFQNGAGGLVGNLDMSGYVDGPNKEQPLIKNCYVAGRNMDYPYKTMIGNDDQFQAPYNISGYSNVGGLIGEGKGRLKIENSFSMAGIFSYMRGNEGSAGGLIGRYDNSSKLTVDTCYFGGRIGRVTQGAGNDPVIGYLIGRTDKKGSGTSETTDANITNCAYRAWAASDAPIGNIWGSVSGIQADLTQFRIRGTDVPADTIVYDENLKNQTYPYTVWTKRQDNQTETYRGDWNN